MQKVLLASASRMKGATWRGHGKGDMARRERERERVEHFWILEHMNNCVAHGAFLSYSQRDQTKNILAFLPYITTAGLGWFRAFWIAIRGTHIYIYIRTLYLLLCR